MRKLLALLLALCLILALPACGGEKMALPAGNASSASAGEAERDQEGQFPAGDEPLFDAVFGAGGDGDQLVDGVWLGKIRGDAIFATRGMEDFADYTLSVTLTLDPDNTFKLETDAPSLLAYLDGRIYRLGLTEEEFERQRGQTEEELLELAEACLKEAGPLQVCEGTYTEENGSIRLQPYPVEDRSVLFQADSLWNKLANNDRTRYELRKYQDYGYLLYADYNDFLKDKYQKLYGEDYEEQKDFKADKKAIQKPETYLENESVQEFIALYEKQGYTLRYLEPVTYENGKLKPGGTGYLLAVLELPYDGRHSASGLWAGNDMRLELEGFTVEMKRR